MSLASNICLIATIALGACGGSVGGKATKEELGKAVIEALSKKDKTTFTSLYISVDALLTACHDRTEVRDQLTEHLERVKAKANTGFWDCMAVDWTKAEVLEINGGDLRGPDEQCDLVHLHDVKVVAEIGGQEVTLQLYHPVKVESGLFLMDRIECRWPISRDSLLPHFLK